ncbi:MAG TPA: hypothetical protein ENH94_11310 [Phycisphaerales bacterium]|nr:hypothetical protein [Phycisphaerales bacterium]
MTKTKQFEYTTKTSLFSGEPMFLKILFLGSKPNFPTQRITTTTCKGETYNNLHPQTNKKSKPNPNPIKANFFTTSKPHFSAACPAIALGRRRKLFSDTRLRQGPPAGCKNGDWLVPAEGRVVPVPFFATAVQRRSREKKPLKLVPACIKQGSPRGETKINPNKPNFKSAKRTSRVEVSPSTTSGFCSCRLFQLYRASCFLPFSYSLNNLKSYKKSYTARKNLSRGIKKPL